MAKSLKANETKVNPETKKISRAWCDEHFSCGDADVCSFFDGVSFMFPSFVPEGFELGTTFGLVNMKLEYRIGADREK